MTDILQTVQSAPSLDSICNKIELRRNGDFSYESYD